MIIPQGFTNDGTEVTADDASNYFGGAIVKISINPTVTFKVVNGSWDDDTTAAKTVACSVSPRVRMAQSDFLPDDAKTAGNTLCIN